MIAERWAVTALRVFLVALFGILVVLETLSIPGSYAYMAQQNPDEAYLRWPRRSSRCSGSCACRSVIVATWKLLTLVRKDLIFTEAAMKWVNVMVWAIAAAWVVLVAVFIWVGFNADDPGVLVLFFLFTSAVSVIGLVLGRDAGAAAACHDVARRHGSGDLMAIVVRIDVELAKRKMSVGEFAEKVGLTPANVAVLKNGRAKAVRFSTLEAMCRVLECQPGDLLEFIDEDEEEALPRSGSSPVGRRLRAAPTRRAVPPAPARSRGPR